MYSISEFSKLVGVTPGTLRRWHETGKLVPDILSSKHRRYTDAHLALVKGIKATNRLCVIYCRESTKQQQTSLKRQEEMLKAFCIKNGITIDKCILDFGSGLNYKRKGLNELIELICKNCVDKVIIFYSDRLMRFGFDMFLSICKIYGTEVIVVDKTENEKSNQQEFAEDLISIVHYFSMRLYGSRSYKTKNNNENIQS